MDIYHIWCNLKTGVSDLEFVARVNNYCGKLQTEGRLGGYRVTRRKLGLGPRDLLEFHLMLEFTDLAQLDSAFGAVAGRAEPLESLHHAVNSLVSEVKFALYRDFPDPVRECGQEKF